MLSDILPTGFEIGVQYGQLKPGDIVAVIGAGSVGLAAITTAALYGPSKVIAIDLDANRIEQAKKFGAPVDLRLQDLWIHDITITMTLVNTNTLPLLLKLVAEKKLNVDRHVLSGGRNQSAKGHHPSLT